MWGFSFYLRFSAKQKSGSHSSCCDNGCYHSFWENASELCPLENWSFWRPKEKCALTVGRELFWIPEPYQLVLKLKKQLMKTGSQCEAQWHSDDWVIIKNINWALKISRWHAAPGVPRDPGLLYFPLECISQQKTIWSKRKFQDTGQVSPFRLFVWLFLFRSKGVVNVELEELSRTRDCSKRTMKTSGSPCLLCGHTGGAVSNNQSL